MKPNLVDKTCELLKWLCNYRKLHNTTTREQLWQYSLLLLTWLSVPSLRGRLMSSSLGNTGWRNSAADWGGGMSVVLCRRSTCPLSQAVDSCISRPVPLADANQLPLPRLWSAAVHVFSCKQRYIKYPDLYLYLYMHNHLLQFIIPDKGRR